jgi:hypothetical protein
MNAAKNKWLLPGVQMALLVWSGTAFATDRVYVDNEGADMVSVHDAVSIPVGKEPNGIRIAPWGGWLHLNTMRSLQPGIQPFDNQKRSAHDH